jgi:hypothetical protein
MLSIIMLSIIMLSIIMLSIIMLSIIMLNVIMLRVVVHTVPPLLGTSGAVLTSADELRFSQHNQEETETSGIHPRCSAINQSINQLVAFIINI